MAKWKIREFGQPNYLTLDVNPSSYGRNRQVDVVYEQLIDGSQCRVVSPAEVKKEEMQLIWANVNQEQLDVLMGYINKQVEIVDHLLANVNAYVDGVERQYLVSATDEQRYAINILLREV
ncbi:MAG: hypothetical protein H6Q72_1901 [Firmicutes bacterium]|nr:hypothetical protein [Bacillota bacterium]